jgi:crotonobetainyl-CoA:carnitine CoA-transferase CaiB-like acyl-CoA transferase
VAAGPLEGLRVVDCASEHGRFAGKVLAELGASVVRLGRGSRGPPLRDPEADARGGLLEWWFDGGKLRLDASLDSEEGRAAYRLLAAAADLVVETEPPGRLAELALDHDELSRRNPRLVQVSLTPFGRTGPRAHWRTSDLVAGALGGVLSVSGTPSQAVGAWGRQNENFAGLMAAICGLAGVHRARETGRGQLVDLSMHEVVCTSIEQLFFQWWFPDRLPIPRRALRQGSLHWLGAYVVTAAETGHVMVCPTPSPGPLFQWMADEGDPEGKELAGMSLEDALAQMPRVMAAIRRFALTKGSAELFFEAQRRRISFGEVQTVAQVAENPQHAHRGFFRDVAWDGPRVTLPGPIARFHGTPAPAPRPPAARASDLAELLAAWARATPAAPTPEPLCHPGPASAGKPLEGVRIVDFTWVLAGPFCCRILGDLGADVLKLQTAERATLVNSPDFPYFYVWNRSKRSATLAMKRPEARDLVRRILERSDVLIENFSAGVLARWGLDYETVRSWNPRIVYVTMSGCGHDGPWAEMITYAPTIHALCGLTWLSNPADRRDVGPGFSLNDHAAGLSAATAILAALESRRRTGEGQHVDVAQLETGTWMVGPALLDYLTNGREARPDGNADPFGERAPNEVFRCGDQEELAITARSDEEWRKLCEVVGPAIAPLAEAPELASVAGRIRRRREIAAALAEWCATRTADAAAEALQAAGVPAGRVQDAGDLMADPQLVARGLFRTGRHEVFGERPYDRFPALWSGTDLEPYVLAPAYLGEHNFEIYGELAGLAPEAIAEAMKSGLFE